MNLSQVIFTRDFSVRVDVEREAKYKKQSPIETATVGRVTGGGLRFGVAKPANRSIISRARATVLTRTKKATFCTPRMARGPFCRTSLACSLAWLPIAKFLTFRFPTGATLSGLIRTLSKQFALIASAKSPQKNSFHFLDVRMCKNCATF